MNGAEAWQQPLQSLLVASVDPTFPEPDRQELNDLLRSNASARRFAARFLVEDALLSEALASAAARHDYVERRRPVNISKVSLIVALSLVFFFSGLLALRGWTPSSYDTLAPVPVVRHVATAPRISRLLPEMPARGPISFACFHQDLLVIHFVDAPLH